MATTEHGRTVLSALEARQGKELGVMRYVLHISLALVSWFRSSQYHRYHALSELRNRNDTRNQ